MVQDVAGFSSSVCERFASQYLTCGEIQRFPLAPLPRAAQLQQLVRLQSLLNALRVGGTLCAASLPTAQGTCMAFSSLSKDHTGSSTEAGDLLLLGSKLFSGLGN